MLWIGLLILGVVGGAAYLYERDRRETRAWLRDVHSQYDSQLSPSEREIRRIAREEAERVMSEQGR